MKSIHQIFENEPIKWGLRGDPYLWVALRENFIDVNSNFKLNEFVAVLNQTFTEIIKKRGTINSDNTVWFSEFPQDGMSGGLVSLDWWKENGIPLLIERYRNLIEQVS